MKGILLIIGLVLVVAGTAIVSHEGLTLYFMTQNQQVLDLGPLEASTRQATGVLRVNAWTGAVGLAAGVLMVLAGAFWHRRSVARKPAQQS